MMLRIADALLRLVLPEGDHGESIIGDLHQEFDLRRGRHAIVAHLWYGASAVSLFVRYGLEKTRARLFDPRPHKRNTEGPLGNLLSDIRFGARVLLRTPQLSAVAILTIALGVGITSHTFSVVYGSILRGLPVPDPETLVDLNGNILSRGIIDNYVSYPDYEAIRDQVTAFTGVAAFQQMSINLAGEDAPPERFTGAAVTDNLFDLVGEEPLFGRGFTTLDTQPGAALTVVLSHQVWQNRFGGDPGVLGTTIRVNAESASVIGVMPERFRFPFDEDLWVPTRIAGGEPRASAPFVGLVGRLKSETTMEAAQAELSALDARIAAEFPDTNEGLTFLVRPYADSAMPPEIQAMLWAMLAAVFGVLLIACVNVANLLLARATLRTKEMAVRTAMGASRWRVTRQLLVESGVLAVLGSLVGLIFAYGGVAAFNRAILDIQKPYWIDIRLDTPTLLFTLFVMAVVAVVAGILPARRAAAVSVGEVLKDESRGSTSSRLGRFSSGLVMAELAVSCALLVSAGLMVKSIVNLRSVDLGFESETLMTGRIALFEGDYPEREDRSQFYRRLQTELGSLPGVTSVGLSTSLPSTGAGRWNFGVEGETYLTNADYPQTWGAVVTDGYFETMGATWVQGRRFEAADIDREADPVVIVNESFARRYLPEGDAIGRRVRLGREGTTNPWMRVVGVVADMYIGGGVGGIGNDRMSPEQVFVPFGLFDLRFTSVVLSTAGAPINLAGPLRETVADMDPNLPVYDVLTMEQVIEQNTWAFGLFGSLFSLFGVVALFLAAVGLYGVMAFSVSQRRQEIGVRMALGAGPRDVLQLVMRKGTLQLSAGLVAGLGLGWLLARPLTVMLYGVDALDPLVYGSIALTLAAAGLLASLIPARAATRADPVSAMRM